MIGTKKLTKKLKDETIKAHNVVPFFFATYSLSCEQRIRFNGVATVRKDYPKLCNNSKKCTGTLFHRLLFVPRLVLLID